jgi:hypothetical protein
VLLIEWIRVKGERWFERIEGLGGWTRDLVSSVLGFDPSLVVGRS